MRQDKVQKDWTTYIWMQIMHQMYGDARRLMDLLQNHWHDLRQAGGTQGLKGNTGNIARN